MAKKTEKTAPTPNAAATNGSPPKPPRQRSPNYPSIDLQAAVGKLPALFTAMKRHPVGVEVAVKAMDLSYSSSTGKLALAAMRSYGLLENVQVGAQATVKLSTRALDIGTDYPPETPQWWSAVKKAALAPSVHMQLWKKYGASLPADDELKRFLVRELKFNDNAVDAFIQEYKKTIAFAKLADSDIIGDEDGRDGDGSEDIPEDRRGSQEKTNRLKRNRVMSAGLKEDVCSLEEGEAVFQWPENLSADSAQDLEDWLQLIGRKIKRAAASAANSRRPNACDPPEQEDDL